MLNRPGFKTSEFMVAVLNGAGQLALALNGTEANSTAAHYTVYGAIAFIISRGLAKYEARGTVVPAPPVPPAG